MASSPTIPYGSANRTWRASNSSRASSARVASATIASKASESSVGGTATTCVMEGGRRGGACGKLTSAGARGNGRRGDRTVGSNPLRAPGDRPFPPDSISPDPQRKRGIPQSESGSDQVLVEPGGAPPGEFGDGRAIGEARRPRGRPAFQESPAARGSPDVPGTGRVAVRGRLYQLDAEVQALRAGFIPRRRIRNEEIDWESRTCSGGRPIRAERDKHQPRASFQD